MSNEAAFPISTEYEPKIDSASGMTLRDYFAAKAMAALIIGPDMREDHYEDSTNILVSERAYLIADRMLEARKCK